MKASRAHILIFFTFRFASLILISVDLFPDMCVASWLAVLPRQKIRPRKGACIEYVLFGLQKQVLWAGVGQFCAK